MQLLSWLLTEKKTFWTEMANLLQTNSIYNISGSWYHHGMSNVLNDTTLAASGIAVGTVRFCVVPDDDITRFGTHGVVHACDAKDARLLSNQHNGHNYTWS